MDLLDGDDEALFVSAVAFFDVVHHVEDLVDVEAFFGHGFEEVTDAVVHVFVDVFEFISAFYEFFCVVVSWLIRFWYLRSLRTLLSRWSNRFSQLFFSQYFRSILFDLLVYFLDWTFLNHRVLRGSHRYYTICGCIKGLHFVSLFLLKLLHHLFSIGFVLLER